MGPFLARHRERNSCAKYPVGCAALPAPRDACSRFPRIFFFSILVIMFTIIYINGIKNKSHLGTNQTLS